MRGPLYPLFPGDVIATDAVRSRMEDLELDYTSSVDGEMTDVDLWREDHRREYSGLADLIEEVCPEGNPRENILLINEDHFTAYVREWYADTYGGQYHEQTREGMARLSWEDIVSQPPFNRIDWEKVAGDEWSDYQQVTVDGCLYLYVEA